MNEEKQLENQKTKKENVIKRPWQANVWVGLMCLSFILIFRFIFWENITCPYFYEPAINYFSCFSWEVSLIFSVIINPFSVLVLLLINYKSILTCILLVFFSFLIREFLMGNKKIVWTVLFVSLVRFSFLIYFLIEAYSDFEHSYYLFYTPITFLLLSIFISFILYLEISCLKHPYYIQKKIKQNKDE